MFLHDGRAHGIERLPNAVQVQHGKEPRLSPTNHAVAENLADSYVEVGAIRKALDTEVTALQFRQ
jgi:hypothetical protein